MHKGDATTINNDGDDDDSLDEDEIYADTNR